MEDATKVQGNGRIEVNLTPAVYRRLSRLFPDPKPAPSDNEGHEEDPPPSYDDVTSTRFPTPLNIVIQVVGSRGDVQPFIALGNELQRHGHRVRLATHDVFHDFIRNSSLEFFPIGGDPADLMAYMVKNPGLIPSMKSLRAGDIQHKRRMVATMLDGCWRSCVHPDPDTGIPFVADAIIANPPSFAHVHCAEALSIPLHLMFTMPWSPTRAYAHPLADIKIKTPHISPEAANYFSYGVVEWMTWQGLGDVINEWRESIDLEAVPFSEGPSLVQTQKIPFTYCWSPSLVPKPFDWPGHIDVCGFFFREAPIFEPNKQLRAFLDAGPPPVYIGFGSIVIDDPSRLTAMIVDTVKRTGIRALISKGWSKLGFVDGQEVQSESIMLLDDCPHEWLFQHVAAVIHHGGAGTTACGLRYGVPTTIVPFFGDQPFWGEMVAAAGAGANPIPHQALTCEILADAIRFCLRPETFAAAKKISDRMRAELGVVRAVQSFHAQLPPVEKLQCDILPEQPAAWNYRGRRQDLKLSKVAYEILKEHLKLGRKSVTLYETKPVTIEPRRWDPVTSTTSAAIGYGVDMTKAVTDVVAKPVRVYRKAAFARKQQRSLEDTTAVAPGTVQQTTLNDLGKTQAASRPELPRPRSCGAPIGAAAVACASSLGHILTLHTKGVFVDVPLATTEGLRAIPKLYGHEVRDHGPVRDWKSGAEVAGKNFAYGLTEGIVDLFVEPVRGGRQEGALGVAKGLGKGLVSIGTKIPSGKFMQLICIMAYN
ncbi:hypothetical protein PFICI_07357 [Pestalotiopsis fici W106-1]|uniref:Uncharacterized protein n=1 Tax=Pestalotiopsis fici (strain W106-1 / CGMCC3.15140) TaxID=1229662 RepID=W3X128_PESFW|nr:uncharacterized protein PFICI_07357 [Pestalotiopsis fici W106-1]ETS79828.1 hypothetical protein PFICI_07357 [Pestalotiopsis fici W106-1]